MASRAHRARIAEETLKVIQTGSYTAPSGSIVSVEGSLRRAIEQSQLIPPDGHASLRAQIKAPQSGSNTHFQVHNESTFSAARRLVGQFGAEKVAALNFASAKNPGGGFLNGSQAQEESLARASALYACLQKHPAYYDANRAERSLLYTDHMILSPGVPVFRDDADELLEDPWQVTIITAPAPNAGAIATNAPESLPDIEPTFRRRIEHVLSAAAASDHIALVLGAWGCGVFGNDPHRVTSLFGDFLLNDGPFAKTFEHIAFAVLDKQGETFAAFSEIFASPLPNR